MGVVGTGPFRRGARVTWSRPLARMSRTWLYLAVPSSSATKQAASSRGLPYLLGQREQAQAGAVAVLGVAPLDQQTLHGAPGGHTDALAPMNQPLGRPLQVGAVGGGHVLDHGGEAALVGTAGKWAATRWPRCSNSTTAAVMRASIT
jgi:hypothetical protein